MESYVLCEDSLDNGSALRYLRLIEVTCDVYVALVFKFF